MTNSPLHRYLTKINLGTDENIHIRVSIRQNYLSPFLTQNPLNQD